MGDDPGGHWAPVNGIDLAVVWEECGAEATFGHEGGTDESRSGGARVNHGRGVDPEVSLL